MEVSQAIDKLVDDYGEWLKSEISIAQFGQFHELTTPYLDRFNDYLQIYVKQEPNGAITLTDDGYIVNNLISSGVTFRANSKRKIMLDRILRNFSLQLVNNAITTVATVQDFPQKKHFMVQAMLQIDDMFVVSPSNVKNFFIEDIETFFKANDIFFSRDYPVLGETGTIYTFDFHFQRSKTQPERFCNAINKLDESRRDLALFNWIATKERRNDEGKFIVILNDENTINDKDMMAFKRFEVEPILFNKREQYKNLFVA